jgi:Surface antigen
MSNPDLSLGKVIAKLDNPAYTTAGGNRFSKGQCTWYAWGRAKEKYKLSLDLPAPANGGDWYNKIVTDGKHVTKRAASLAPLTDSIASFAHKDCGHVVFVECVKDGEVYFTEYNWDQTQNGKVQSCAVKDFPSLHGCKLNGYIIIR